MVKTQSSNFDAEWRDGNDSEMRCESLAGASPGMGESASATLWRGSWQISSSFPPSCGFISI